MTQGTTRLATTLFASALCLSQCGETAVPTVMAEPALDLPPPPMSAAASVTLQPATTAGTSPCHGTGKRITSPSGRPLLASFRAP